MLEAAEAVGVQQRMRLPAGLRRALAEDLQAELRVLHHRAPFE
jgi:hypothetical protein